MPALGGKQDTSSWSRTSPWLVNTRPFNWLSGHLEEKLVNSQKSVFLITIINSPCSTTSSLISAWVPVRSGAAHVRREVTVVGNQNPADLPEPKLSSRDDIGATSFGAVTPRHNSPTARGGMFLAAYHDSLQGFTSIAWRQGASKVAFYEISRYQKLGPKTSLANIMGPGKKRQRLD